MPRRKSASSLEELCSDVVTTHFEKKQMQDRLVSLPPVLINDLFEKLCVQFERTDRRLPAKIFIRPGAKSLHHLHQFSTTMRSLYDKIGKMCKNLVALNLVKVSGHSSDSEDSAEDLDVSRYFEDREMVIASKIKLMQSLPKLQRLDIECSYEFTDEVAAAIAKNCPLLTHLNLACCFQLSDIGLGALSFCVQLEYLDIQRTRASVDGCLFLLNQLPKLKVFGHSNWLELFIKLEKQTNTRTYSIEEVPYIKNNKHTPMLRTIFPNLKCLRLSNVESHLDSSNSIWPQHVTTVHLCAVWPVNVGLIDHAFPMLEKLSLLDCTIFDEVDGIVDAPLKNLRKLHFVCRTPLFTEQEMKTFLVKRRGLEKLYFTDCGMEVTDDLISELVEADALQNIKVLIFTLCPYITSPSIIKLLGLQNAMNKLTIIGCDNIDASACDAINSYVKSKNLDVQTRLKE